MSEVRFKLAAGTNVGLIRQNNEDNFVVCSDLSTSNWLIPQAGDYADLGQFGVLLVVADGMGGANAGEVASAIAVETIQNQFVPEQLEEAVANQVTDVGPCCLRRHQGTPKLLSVVFRKLAYDA